MKTSKMTKKQVLNEFKEYILPVIKRKEKEYKCGIDHIRRREEWNNFTDSLLIDGFITVNQYNNWTNPF